jgi:sensor domain CHASE-containing protein
MNELSVQGIVRELALQLEVVAVWDDPVLQLRNTPPNPEWLDENLSSWLHRTYGHDQVYIVNASNEPIYAALDGTRAEPGDYNQVRAAVESHLKELRERGVSPSQGREPATDGKHLTSGKAVYDTHLLKLLGRPAAVGAMRIVPHSEAVPQQPGTEPILMSVRFLDDTFLQQLAEKNLIEGLRFSPSSQASGS